MSIAVIALGLSVDSGIACIGRGAGHTKPQINDALATGLIFGLVEAMTPVIGWGAGWAARSYVLAVDHWIAFCLLGLVGAQMVFHGVRGPRPSVARPHAATSTAFILVATAVGTSIDAMAVGVSLALVQANIVAVSLAVGTTTFIFSVGGLMIGRFIGERLGRWAEVAGGVALALLGLTILLDHVLA